MTRRIEEQSAEDLTVSRGLTEGLEYLNMVIAADAQCIEVLGPKNRWRKMYKCSSCVQVYFERYQFLAHCMKHLKGKNFICSVCHQAFQHKTTMLKHMKLHRGETYKCDICHKQFPVKFNYDKHLRSYPPSATTPCTKCTRRFHSRKDMLIHLAKDHEKKFHCYICQEKFCSPDPLKSHILIEHPDIIKTAAKYQCDFCGKRFAKNHVLNAHLRGQHLDMRSVVCEICGKKLSSVTSLNEHVLLHSGEKPLSCEHCGRTFAKKNTLNVHLRTHSGERPYACPYCDKRFTQSSAAAIHARKHTGDRPYSCELCGEGFVSKSCLKLHRKSKHQLL